MVAGRSVGGPLRPAVHGHLSHNLPPVDMSLPHAHVACMHSIQATLASSVIACADIIVYTANQLCNARCVCVRVRKITALGIKSVPTLARVEAFPSLEGREWLLTCCCRGKRRRPVGFINSVITCRSAPSLPRAGGTYAHASVAAREHEQRSIANGPISSLCPVRHVHRRPGSSVSSQLPVRTCRRLQPRVLTLQLEFMLTSSCDLRRPPSTCRTVPTAPRWRRRRRCR